MRYSDIGRAVLCFFFFSSRRRHTRFKCDWSSDVCSSDLFCFQKSKSDKADKNPSVPAIEFGADVDERKKEPGVHLIVHHGQVQPFPGEEDSFESHTFSNALASVPIHLDVVPSLATRTYYPV